MVLAPLSVIASFVSGRDGQEAAQDVPVALDDVGLGRALPSWAGSPPRWNRPACGRASSSLPRRANEPVAVVAGDREDVVGHVGVLADVVGPLVLPVARAEAQAA